jgi:hypothetical protein
MLKPQGFVLAMRLHPLVSETAALLSECLRLRLASNRLMSLLQELLSTYGQMFDDYIVIKQW